MESKNIIKVYTTSSGAELNISTPNIKQVISATNNRAQYFSEQAKKFRDEAKMFSDNAQYYAEQNADVTYEYIETVKASLQEQIAEKQPVGDYALKEELPIKVSELINDAEYVNQTDFLLKTTELELPSQEGCEGKFLTTNGEKESWIGLNSFQLFDTKISDRILSYEESKGWALQGSYVYKGALAGSRYGYPDFYNKCLEEYQNATDTETVNGVSVKVCQNGHKFYNISDKSSIDSFFNSIGSAWFYGIDTVNERVFLPRNGYFEQVTMDTTVVGSSIEAGLPNIIGSFHGAVGGANGAFKDTGGAPGGVATGGYQNPTISFNASNYNSIYGNSTTVQPCAVKKLLYICVGNTTNYEGITEVVSQGVNILDQVNQGLVSKMNLDISNISKEGKSAIISMCMPDYSNSITLPLTWATAMSYTAPSNGVIVVDFTGYNSSPSVKSYLKINGIVMFNGSNNNSSSYINTKTGQYFVSKGDIVQYMANYAVSTSPYAEESIKFIPLKGVN